jgi:hypothetical protein
MKINIRTGTVVLLILLTLVITLFLALRNFCPTLWCFKNNSSTSLETSILQDRPSENLKDYKDAKSMIESKRRELTSLYNQAVSNPSRDSVIEEARSFIIESIYNELFPHWYGTEWDFNGTTEVPGSGMIACGYFVSTILRDAGFKVERYKLAQQASENITISLATEEHIKRFSNTPINGFIDSVKQWGSGLYVVGLDIHVGFIINSGSEVYFIHSSYMHPLCVVKERASESKALTVSNLRVLGKISADDHLIEKWLFGKKIKTFTGNP